MPRRSARLAAKQHGSQQQTAAARTLAIPEILDLVIEHAFTSPNALPLRAVNRLFKSVAETHLVSSVVSNEGSLHSFPPWPSNGSRYKLDSILSPNADLWRYVKIAYLNSRDKLVAFISHGNLTCLTLGYASILDAVVSLFKATPFQLSNLCFLEIKLESPGESGCSRSDMQAFITSLNALRTLHVFLRGSTFGECSLFTYQIDTLLQGVAPRIREFMLLPCYVDHGVVVDLKSILQNFVNLRHFFLSIEQYESSEDITEAFPSYITELTVECTHDILRRILERLADPTWLPLLRRVPYLQELGTDDDGEYVEGLATMPPVLVRRAIAGLRKREGVKDVEDRKWTLLCLIDEDTLG